MKKNNLPAYSQADYYTTFISISKALSGIASRRIRHCNTLFSSTCACKMRPESAKNRLSPASSMRSAASSAS